MNSAASVARCAAGSRRLRVAGVAATAAIRNTSSEAAAQYGIRLPPEGCVPDVRTSGATRRACDVRAGPYTKIGMLWTRIDRREVISDAVEEQC
jgi:hypothetical protein